jgi:hypothetical protein
VIWESRESHALGGLVLNNVLQHTHIRRCSDRPSGSCVSNSPGTFPITHIASAGIAPTRTADAIVGAIYVIGRSVTPTNIAEAVETIATYLECEAVIGNVMVPVRLWRLTAV